jgi:hypothetical protein
LRPSISRCRSGEKDLRRLKNSVEDWILAGEAWAELQRFAIARAGARNPKGKRYNEVWNGLAQPWPELAKAARRAG